MGGVSSVGAAAEQLGEIMQMANAKMLKQAENMMKVNVEMALGSEAGKGQNIDVSA